jgi:TBC1 domain family member 8/9
VCRKISERFAIIADQILGIAKWAITDSPSSPPEQNGTQSPHSYFGNSTRSRPPVSPWGSGPEPADHEFMKRLFRRWDVDMTDSLSLQNVVTGFANVKGTKDIMSNISYFFELYDDDGDGKVDREGILRISEALLFLSRRGFGDARSASASTLDIQSGVSPERGNRDEQFLSSVSAFIRRCFEYADPDHPSNQGGQAMKEAEEGLDNFAIGEDDLIDFDSAPNSPSTEKASSSPTQKHQKHPLSPTASNTDPLATVDTNSSDDSDPSGKSEKAQAANLALDPNKPLHITLPTFRMVILADEILEHFFEFGFSASFRLADAPLLQAASSSNLTTFSNAGKQVAAAASGMGGVVGGAGAGVVPPGKGLRGMLDNIVSDGMRVAAEVRRRMDEAQKEMDREARHGREDEEDEEEPSSAKDIDLLEGAETADVDTNRGTAPTLLSPPGGTSEIEPTRDRTGSDASRRVLEFER